MRHKLSARVKIKNGLPAETKYCQKDSNRKAEHVPNENRSILPMEKFPENGRHN